MLPNKLDITKVSELRSTIFEGDNLTFHEL